MNSQLSVFVILKNSLLTTNRRIQTCIHRYRSRRRFDNEAALYFEEYAFLGGIDISGSRFTEQGLEPTSLLPQAHTASQDQDASATTTTAPSRFYDGNTDNWTVDFSTVVAGFLSISLVGLTGLEPTPTEKAIAVIENFLRYVLQHDVCPEYADDVRGALQVCKQAREEWPRTYRFKSKLPGAFQLAAAQTFDVHEQSDWSRCQPDTTGTCTPPVVFYASLVAAGLPAPPKDADTGRSAVEIVRQFTASLALRRLEMPSEATVNYFCRLALAPAAATSPSSLDGDQQHTPLGLQPLGRAVFRPTVIQDGWVRQSKASPIGEEEDVVFFFEKEILEEMTLGMKVTACVAELSMGFRFVKKFEVVQPSFYVFLPQHLTRYFKPPTVNDRPPRSIHDAAGATAMEEDGEGQEE